MEEFLDNEKPYLDNELNMHGLTEGTGLSKHRISELLNNELNKTFYDIIEKHGLRSVRFTDRMRSGARRLG